jgi:hypothetical protein
MLALVWIWKVPTLVMLELVKVMSPEAQVVVPDRVSDALVSVSSP